MFWFLFGVMLVLLIRNQFDMQGVLRDIRRIAKAVRGILRDLSRTIRAFAKDAKRKKPREVRKAADLKPNGAEEGIRAEQPAQVRAPEGTEWQREQEQAARTAAMMMNVPTIDFPKEDPKYNSSRKYRYA